MTGFVRPAQSLPVRWTGLTNVKYLGHLTSNRNRATRAIVHRADNVLCWRGAELHPRPLVRPEDIRQSVRTFVTVDAQVRIP